MARVNQLRKRHRVVAKVFCNHLESIVRVLELSIEEIKTRNVSSSSPVLLLVRFSLVQSTQEIAYLGQEQVVLLCIGLLHSADIRHRSLLNHALWTFAIRRVRKTTLMERVSTQKVHGGQVQRSTAAAALGHLEDTC